MKFYYHLFKLLFNKFILGKNTGLVIKEFCEKMGVVYIKLAQILSTQNYGNIFTEQDRVVLSSICDHCNPISFNQIKVIIEKEYGCSIEDMFNSIEILPVGSASISQVHKAILKNGDVVAVKIKRNDITKTIEKDIKHIRKLMYRFGKFINFGNLVGGDEALEFYLKWIYQETDFKHEKDNIGVYHNFIDSVNGKIEGNKLISIPRLYEELCTDNIIVMEFIEHKTINKLELNEMNKEKIRSALNSFISSTLYAMFNDLKIVFHGDPHGGNIYIDDEGNIGFLDMGLLFELSEEDARMAKEFFFAAYFRDYKKMCDLVIPFAKLNPVKRMQFEQAVKNYADNLAGKPVTSYFIDMMNVCLKFEILPPNFLFCVAKTFMCLSGINNFSNNLLSGTDLLKEQVLEYYIEKTIKGSEEIVVNSFKLVPKFVGNSFKFGAVKGLVKGVNDLETIYEQARELCDNCKEMIDLLKMNTNE